jgi:hypothetical protein
MFRKRWGAVLGVVVTALSFVAPTSARAAEPLYSVNWSGYAVAAGSGQRIDQVNGAWTVPEVKNLPPGFSSSWIGIGGYQTQDLIQVGTESDGRLGGNHAWYEMLPDNSIPITSGCAGDTTCKVDSGDNMAADIRNLGGDNWVITINNFAHSPSPKWSWQKTFQYKSSFSSAEYIFEAPQVGFSVAGVGLGGMQTLPARAPHARFLPGAALTVNGVTRSLASSSPTRVVMFAGAVRLVHTATPSGLASDGHFQVCAYANRCKNY